MADKWVVCQEETIGLQGHLTLAEHPCQVSHSALMGAGRLLCAPWTASIGPIS